MAFHKPGKLPWNVSIPALHAWFGPSGLWRLQRLNIGWLLKELSTICTFGTYYSPWCSADSYDSCQCYLVFDLSDGNLTLKYVIVSHLTYVYIHTQSYSRKIYNIYILCMCVCVCVYIDIPRERDDAALWRIDLAAVTKSYPFSSRMGSLWFQVGHSQCHKLILLTKYRIAVRVNIGKLTK